MSEPFRLLRPQGLILSLCDYTGAWSQPYEDDGYEVARVDVQHGQDVRLLELPDTPVHGILAAPPCTMFANAAAHAGSGPRRRCSKRCPWSTRAVGSSLLPSRRGGCWRTRYGDDYTKFTCLWGDFNPPVKTPVPATAGSKMHRLGPSPNRAMLRSVTPAGFAQAFWRANP